MLTFKWIAGAALASTFCVVAPAAAKSAPSVFVPLDPAQGQLPESITADAKGNIYLSMGTTVGRITPGGQLSTFAALPVDPSAFTTGLKFGPDGYLYAGTANFPGSPDSAYIWRISPSGAKVQKYADLDGNGFPNDLAFDEDGNLYVTDPFLGLIWKIDEDGNEDVWLADPLFEPSPTPGGYLGVAAFGVDGIAFDEDEDYLYVGNLDYGRILRIELDGCEPGDVEVFYENLGLIGGVDGLAFDDKENLYLAVHGQDRIVALDKKAKPKIVAEGGPLQQPSSLVFGTTKATRKTLFISNFSILAALGIKPGPPTPALLTLKVSHEGLELP